MIFSTSLRCSQGRSSTGIDIDVIYMDDKEAEGAIKAVDDMEDEEAMNREKAADEGEEKGEEDIVFCPKCKRPVTEGDYVDQLAKPMEDTIMTKIVCTQCGYSGLPVEMDAKEYQKMIKENQKK